MVGADAADQIVDYADQGTKIFVEGCRSRAVALVVPSSPHALGVILDKLMGKLTFTSAKTVMISASDGASLGLTSGADGLALALDGVATSADGPTILGEMLDDVRRGGWVALSGLLSLDPSQCPNGWFGCGDDRIWLRQATVEISLFLSFSLSFSLSLLGS